MRSIRQLGKKNATSEFKVIQWELFGITHFTLTILQPNQTQKKFLKSQLINIQDDWKNEKEISLDQSL